MASHEDNTISFLEAFVKHLSDSASRNLTEIDSSHTKSYISDVTWTLIEERDASRTSGDVEKEQRLSKGIKKKADADKQNFVVNKLEQGINLKEKWQGIKDRKGKFVPNFTKQKDIRGNIILPKKKKAEAIAEHLS